MSQAAEIAQKGVKTKSVLEETIPVPVVVFLGEMGIAAESIVPTAQTRIVISSAKATQLGVKDKKGDVRVMDAFHLMERVVHLLHAIYA